MATIDSRKIVDEIIAGEYPEDGWSKIVEYTNMEGKRTWGCLCEHDRDQDVYERETEFIRNPVVIWRAGET